MIDGVIAYQRGIFPRSEDVVAATRGLERGRVAQQAVDARFEADLDLFVQTQREARLDYFSDGMLRWQDVFRPFVEACSGLQARGLVRWFDNNSFLRAPEVIGALRPDVGFASVAPPLASQSRACLPPLAIPVLPCRRRARQPEHPHARGREVDSAPPSKNSSSKGADWCIFRSRGSPISGSSSATGTSSSGRFTSFGTSPPLTW